MSRAAMWRSNTAGPRANTTRLLWVWLYRIWPQVIDAMVLVKPATVVPWHRNGVRLYWRWRSRRPGRVGTEIRDLIRRMSKANPLWGARGTCSSSASRSARPQLGGGCRGGPKSWRGGTLRLSPPNCPEFIFKQTGGRNWRWTCRYGYVSRQPNDARGPPLSGC